MDPELYNALREKIQSLADTATRMTLPEGMSSTAMKNRILRMAAEIKVPVTVRKVPGGLLFWRSTDQDLAQAKEVAQRLQTARQPPQPPQRGTRRRRT
jgi:precorrin-4 methylase